MPNVASTLSLHPQNVCIGSDSPDSSSIGNDFDLGELTDRPFALMTVVVRDCDVESNSLALEDRRCECGSVMWELYPRCLRRSSSSFLGDTNGFRAGMLAQIMATLTSTMDQRFT
jgi:hypothetical protein